VGVEETWSLDRSLAGREERDLLDELAAQTRDGDQRAFEQVYFLLVDDVYGYVRSQCSSTADAEDVVSTIFLRAWQYARQYRAGTGAYRRWVFGIARNEVRNSWQKERRARELQAALQRDRTTAAEESVTLPPTTDDTALERAIAELTEEQREVIILRFLNGKTPGEVARILGKREGSVRALQHRALRRLRSAVNHAAP
jgi:RNA polymerase sigma-70 factor (ECF subfamily)